MKKKIALVAGGDSEEYVISMKSAGMIRKNLDSDRYEVYLVLIREGKWICQTDSGKEVAVDKNDFSVVIDGMHIRFDCAFITIHGTPGEDGKLQGYFDLVGIPYTTAGQLPTAITFNKHFCNIVASHFGLAVPASVKLQKEYRFDTDGLINKIKLPMFVKPNKGGSSLGNSLVESPDALQPAIELAFKHDNEVLVEEFISGQELTCGVFRRDGEVLALPVTYIKSKSGAIFFDYKAKYNKEAADEITPAPIPDELTRLVRETTARLYECFELKGMARMDYIYANGTLYFLEINITPGMSETSIVPQQAAIEGISITELFTAVIEDALGGYTMR